MPADLQTLIQVNHPAEGKPMPLPFFRLSLTACVIVCLCSSVHGENPKVIGPAISGTPNQPGIDQYGDPLPPGALARMGTTRLRHEGTHFLAFSPDGEALASAGGGGFIRLWEVRTGKEIHRFPQPSPSCVAFSPGGKMMASGGWYGHVVLWDLDTKKELRRLAGHKNQVYSLAFSPDGRLLASASRDQTARVWEVASGKEIWQFPDHNKEVQSVAFSPDGKALATGGCDGTIRLWDLATGKEVRRFQKHSGQPLSLVFSADGKTLVCGGAGDIPTGPGEVNAWNVASGKNLSKYKEERHWFAAVLSPDGKLVAVDETGSDGVKLREAATGKEIGKTTSQSLAFEMAFSMDGKLLATTGTDSAIQIWDVATMKAVYQIGPHQHRITAVAFAGKGKFLATASTERVVLWESQTGKQVGSLGANLKYEPVLAASTDGKLLAVGSADIALWDVEKRQLLHRLPVTLLSRPSLVFSSDSGSVIAPGSEESLAVWDVASGKKAAKFAAKKDVVEFIQFHDIALVPSRKSVVAAGFDYRNGQVVCARWETASDKEPVVFRCNSAILTFHLALSPDGQWLASQDMGDVIHVYEVTTGKERFQFATPKSKNNESFVTCMAFSPDGKTLATGNSDLSIRLWEVATGKERHQLRGHRDRIKRLIFSPNGERIASVGDDTTALVWDVPALARDKAVLKKLPELWGDLADQDASKAYQAIWALALTPKRSLPFLREQLRPVVPADPELTSRLIADLDSEKFAVREKASQQLAELGDRAGSQLQKALEGNPSPETRKRVVQLLERLEAPALSGDPLRLQHALEILELIGTSEAQGLLQTLAKGTSEARLTKEAKAALERLIKRPETMP